MKYRFSIIFLLALVSSCAIEVGNPSTKSSAPKGTVNIYFGKTLGLTTQVMQLNVASLEVSSSSDSKTSTQPLKTSAEGINLYSDKEDDDAVAVKGQPLLAGSYDTVMIYLAKNKPVTYRGSDGKELDVDTDLGERNTIVLTQKFDVAEGKSTDVIINLDLNRSLQRNSDKPDRIRFSPHGGILPGLFEGRFEGKAPSKDIVWVCAYAYGVNFSPPPPPRPLQVSEQKANGVIMAPRPQAGSKLQAPGAPPPGAPPPPPPERLSHQVFDSKQAVIKDDTSQCDHAFAKIAVINQAYVLRRLPPGAYTLRFFKADDSHIDGDEDIKLAP